MNINEVSLTPYKAIECWDFNEVFCRHTSLLNNGTSMKYPWFPMRSLYTKNSMKCPGFPPKLLSVGTSITYPCYPMRLLNAGTSVKYLCCPMRLFNVGI